MEELFLPVLSHFQNGNAWTGSGGALRYRIVPGDEGLSAEVWEGPWCYELSRVEEARTFPLEEAGLVALSGWLGERLAGAAGRPVKSLEEALQTRDALAAEQTAGA